MDDLFDNPDDRLAYETFCEEQERAGSEPFQLAEPALVCRWRMASRQVPLLNRHIRALSRRAVNGLPLTRNMLAWAKQHVEWSLAEGTYEDPNGVLMLVVDVDGNAAMTVGPYEPLPETGIEALLGRARRARAEQGETGVAPELLCAVRDGALELAADPVEPLSGSADLLEQLARTLGRDVRRAGGGAAESLAHAGAALLVSDEHGVVVADESLATGPEGDVEFARELARGVSRLFEGRR